MANLGAELAKFFAQKVPRTFLGTVKPCIKKNATKVVVTELKMDENLTAVSIFEFSQFISFLNVPKFIGYFQFFKHEDIYYAYDPEKICKTGDLVLIRELKEKKSSVITHEVMKVIYPLGDTTCPLTNKKVVKLYYKTPEYR